MHIDVRLENVQGEAAEVLLDTQGRLAALIETHRQAFEALKFVDLYGDAIFNKLQATGLLHDIKLLQAIYGCGEDNDVLNGLYALTTTLAEGDLLYLRFVGD